MASALVMVRGRATEGGPCAVYLLSHRPGIGSINLQGLKSAVPETQGGSGEHFLGYLLPEGPAWDMCLLRLSLEPRESLAESTNQGERQDMSTCSYTGEVLDRPGCENACRGCEWESEVSCQHNGSSCHFEWTVNRSGCSFSGDAEFTGSETVPCGQTVKKTFYCDSTAICPGYQLTLVCGACPTPPDGPG